MVDGNKYVVNVVFIAFYFDKVICFFESLRGFVFFYKLLIFIKSYYLADFLMLNYET